MTRLFKFVLPIIGKLVFLLLVVLGIVSGLSSFLFISTTTKVIGVISSGSYKTISIKYLIIFIAIMILIIVVRKILSVSIIRISQRIFWGLRKEILSIVLKASYEQLHTRKIQIQSSLLGDVYILTDAAMSIIGFSTALILSISCFIYLASISLILFAITLVVAMIGVSVYYFKSISYNKFFAMAREEENKFVVNFIVILEGFKEIFMEPKKGRQIFEDKIQDISKDAFKYTTAAQTGFLNNQITGQILFYILVTSILLVLSIIVKISFSNTVSFVFALFYLLGSIETIMILLPNLMRARVSANHLMDLKHDLESSNFDNLISESTVSKADFEKITIKDLEYSYGTDEKSFKIGPINFEIKKGEVIFINGDNGSGKTTLIQSILGLRIPTKGNIWLNDNLVEHDFYPKYKTAFSVVFSDFYLFSELLGIGEVDLEKWNYYINLFELDGKVSLKEKNRFSSTDLSTGQRKRLALIAALLENKPIIVIDEWAADQDPYFRKKFYTQIIPVLVLEGFTIIAITHDDKYYPCADRNYRMNFGELICTPSLTTSIID